MDVNLADTDDLLHAAVAVEVMFTKDHTPRPTAAIFTLKQHDIVNNNGMDRAHKTQN